MTSTQDHYQKRFALRQAGLRKHCCSYCRPFMVRGLHYVH